MLNMLELEKQQGFVLFFRSFDLILIVTSSVFSVVLGLEMSSAIVSFKSV